MKDKIHILLEVDEQFEPKAKYVFQTIFQILGYQPRFFSGITSEEIHLFYGVRTKDKYPIRIYRGLETALFFHKKEPYPEEKYNSVLYKDEYIPFLFSKSGPIFSIHESNVIIRKDIISSAFYFLSCWQEYAFPKQRYDYKKSLQYRFHFAEIPVVERYAEILANALSIALPGFQSKPIWQRDYAAVITHDIDYWKFWTKTEIKKMDQRLKKKMKKRLIPNAIQYLKHSIHKKWNFQHTQPIRKMMKEEKSKHIESSFFLLTKPDFPYSPLNYFEKSQDEINDLLPPERMHLQGSKESAINFEQLQFELSKLTGFANLGFRIRYLNADFQKLFQILEQAQVAFDSSIGFDGIVGFRAGISLPFYPFNIEENRPFRVLEIPVAISDRSFFSLQKIDKKKKLYQMRLLLDKAQKHHTLVTVIWHNHVFDPVEFPLLYKLYQSLLRQLKRSRAECTTIESLYQHWINFDK